MWLTIEKDDDERYKASEVSYLMNAVVHLLVDKMTIEPAEARKRCDADYARGYIMYLVAEVVTVADDGVATTKKKMLHRIIDSKDGDRYFTTDAARDLADLKELPWDDTITHVNGMVSKNEAWTGG